MNFHDFEKSLKQPAFLYDEHLLRLHDFKKS